MPWRIDEQLHAVALGVGEVDRPRVAVGDDAELLDALGPHARVHGLEVGELRQLERDLIDHVVAGAGGPAGDEHHLVMLVGIAGEEGELGSAFERAAIGHHQTEHARVEVHHLLEVRHVDPEVAEGGCVHRVLHGRLVPSVWVSPMTSSGL